MSGVCVYECVCEMRVVFVCCMYECVCWEGVCVCVFGGGLNMCAVCVCECVCAARWCVCGARAHARVCVRL